jgi:hypothetical protein
MVEFGDLSLDIPGVRTPLDVDDVSQRQWHLNRPA